MRPDSTLESDTVSFAPVADMSCTRHWRVAKPPSRVTQAVCCTDLRTSRFLAAGTMLFRLEMIVRAFLSERTLKTVANYRSERWGSLVIISCRDGPGAHSPNGKTGLRVACPGAQTPLYVRPLVFGRLLGQTGKVNKPFQGIDSLVKFR